MNFTNKAELEQYFSENFDTVFFPILADIYKKEGDYNRARKVCEIGLEYHPNNVPGHYVLAEVYKLEGMLNEAEKYYKNVLSIDPWHYRANVNLVKIQTELERAPESLAKLWRKVLRINPTHKEALSFFNIKIPDEQEPTEEKEADVIEDNNGQEPINEKEADVVKDDDTVEPQSEKEPEKKLDENEKEQLIDQIDKEVNELKQKLEISTDDTSEETSPEIDMTEADKVTLDTEQILAPKPPSIKPQKISEDELQSLDITPRMATFTLVNVLKKQKLYQQSLYVLKMLEEKGADQALINQERQAIKALIAESEAN